MLNVGEIITSNINENIELKYLWEVTIWDKNFSNLKDIVLNKKIKYKYFLVKDIKKIVNNNGNVKILTTNETNLFTREELVLPFLNKGQVVCIPGGGNPIVQYFNGTFITTDNRLAVSFDENILRTKYLYYFLKNNINTIKSFYRGSSLLHPDMSKILKMQIQIPTIKHQDNIIFLLDNLNLLINKLKNNLNCEINLRKLIIKKYIENKTNSFKDFLSLKEVCAINTGKRLTRANLNKKSKYPVYHAGIKPLGYYNYSNAPKNTTMIINTGDAGKIGFSKEDFWSSDGCYWLKCNDSYNNKFLYYFLLSKEDFLKSKIRKGGIPTLNKEVVQKLKVPFVSYEEQNNIVTFLDNLLDYSNELINNLNLEIKNLEVKEKYYINKLFSYKKEIKND